MIYFTIYLAAISLLAIVITLHDKRAAKRNKRRVRERTLLLVAALGGAVAMLLCMYTIRHKTRHKKFMIGLPVAIILQLALVIAIWLLR